MPTLSHLPLLVGLSVLLCALVVSAQHESVSTVEKLAQDPRFGAFLPSSFKMSDTAFRSFEQLQEEFASFMSKLPRLWTSPRPVRHTPTAWRPTRETDNRGSARATTSGPCNSPFGQPVQAMVDPCGPSHECYAAEVKCEGAIADPENLLAKDAQNRNCTVRQVKCTNISSPIPQLPSESCTLRTLECPAQENATLSQCKLRELVCGQALVRFADVNAAACPSNSAPGLQCNDACTPMATDKTVCVCSMDRMGHTCNEWRPYSCNLTLLSPEPSCQSTILDSDPICFLYSRQQKVPFNYSIQCSFTNTTGIKESVAHDSLFEYWGRRNKEFAISIEQQKLWPLDSELCVYDFNRLGNRNGCQNISLSPEQLCLYSPITFPVDFSKFTDNFFAGNRLYFEVGLTKASSFTGRLIKRDRRFIDFTDLHIHRSIDDSLSNVAISWIVVGAVCGSVCLLCTGFTIRQRIEKYKLKQRIKKLE